MDIITKKRSGDWKAYLADNPKVWEAGKTQVEAIGKLMISTGAMMGITILKG